VSPGWPNGGTRRASRPVTRATARERTRGTETSQYPVEEKSSEMPLVAASERGRGLPVRGPGLNRPPSRGRGCRSRGRVGLEPAEVPWNGAPEAVRAR
jgi:hypothetical protein